MDLHPPAQFGKNVHLGSPLILRNGSLYSTVASSTGGAAFELQPPSAPGGAWTLTYLYQFTNYQQPTGSLVVDGGGTLFGVTAAAPYQPVTGTVYRLATK